MFPPLVPPPRLRARGCRRQPEALFTVGATLFGTSGRTDLLNHEHADVLPHRQFSSLRRPEARPARRAVVLVNDEYDSTRRAGLES